MADQESKVSVYRTKAPVGAEFLADLGNRYLAQFFGFRDLNNLADETKDAGNSVFSNINPKTLSPKDREDFVEVSRQLVALISAATQSEIRDPQSGEVISLPDIKEGTEIDLSAYSPEVAAIMSDLINRGIYQTLAPKRRDLISQSLMANIVSSFEVLMGSVAKEVFNKNKAALEKSDHEFTLEELANYSSIEEAREELINRRVDALLMKSVDDWSKWCRTAAQFDFQSLTSRWPAIRETFARRNIIVHNGGRINKRYLDIVKESGAILPNEASIGAEVITEKDDVDKAIQLILSLGLCFTYRIWRQFYPKLAEEAAAWLLSKQQIIFYEKMWWAVSEISGVLKQSRARRSTISMTQVYSWVARKELGNDEEVRKEVSEWDVSGLEVSYMTFKAILLDDLDEAHRLIMENIGKSPFTRYELYVNPIYSALREHDLIQLVADEKLSLEQPPVAADASDLPPPS